MITTAGPVSLVGMPAVPFLQPPRYRLVGITKDSGGNPLGACTVEVFETVSGLLRGSTVSDANGNYSLDVTVSAGTGLTFFCNGYLAGSPDVAGTTVNTLVGVAS
jgi:hypothetical protein